MTLPQRVQRIEYSGRRISCSPLVDCVGPCSEVTQYCVRFEGRSSLRRLDFKSSVWQGDCLPGLLLMGLAYCRV
jgi:hypothetical protein